MGRVLPDGSGLFQFQIVKEAILLLHSGQISLKEAEIFSPKMFAAAA